MSHPCSRVRSMDIGHIILIIAALLLGGWAAAASATAAARKRQAASDLEAARAETERVREEEKAKQADQKEVFEGLAHDVLTKITKDTSEQRNEEFELKAKNVLGPVEAQLKTLETRNKEFQEHLTSAKGDYGKVDKTLVDVVKATNDLTSILGSSSARGDWSEYTLKRIVELSGMTERVDYQLQVPLTKASGNKARPDALIHIPGGLSVIIDSKAPFDQYRMAHEATDDNTRASHLDGHVKAVMERAKELGDRSYIDDVRAAKDLATSPEFVVMFLPIDAMLNDALVVQPTLWEDAWTKHRVLIVTPVNLIAFLQTVARGWHQHAISEKAEEIANAGTDLYKRIGTFAEHFAKVGRGLKTAVNAYNDSVGSHNRMLLPGARKLAALSNIKEEAEELVTVIDVPTSDIITDDVADDDTNDDSNAVTDSPLATTNTTDTTTEQSSEWGDEAQAA